MKITKLKSLLSAAVIGGMLFAGCADLGVENVNDPTKEAVEGNAANQSKLLAGGFYDLTTAIVASWGVNINMIADQNTSTNNFRNYWDFTDEPRRRLNNTTSYPSTAVFTSFYGGFNSSISTANLFINNIVNNGNTITDASGNDVTSAILAQAYFLRGTARGYLGLMYDQAFLIDENFVIGEDTPEFAPYTALIDASIADLNEAISLAEGASNFTFNAMPNPAESWNGEEFVAVVNSFAARILAGEARTASEAANTDWAQVLQYAENGVGQAGGIDVFANSNIGSSGEYANYLNDWGNFVVAGSFTTGAGYNPTDIKVIHMMDPSYPVEYPADQAQGSTAALAPAETNDPRIAYYQYTTNAGFLSDSRNAALYSNYFSARFFANSDWWPAENDIIFFTDTETELLIAEANLWLGNNAAAAQALNASPAGTGTTTYSFEFPAQRLGLVEEVALSGGYTFTGAESLAEMQFALLREYSVEIHTNGGVGVPWFFMRRHDMLQPGSATMLPVPGSELEILGLDNYTFGGPSFAGQVGTASGANNWKNLAASAGLAKSISNAKVANRDAKIIPEREAKESFLRSKLGQKGAGNH